MNRSLRAMVAAALLAGCRGGEAADPGPPLFERLDAGRTGVRFENHLPEDSSFNILNYLYYYNGGGVAAGDVNGDGRPDLFFTSNLGSSRLYLNRGDFRFDDVTERAGVGGSVGWTAGVTMADVDGDGHLDLYVSGVSYLTMQGRNILYVNDGHGSFTDRTREFGLEHAGYSTQALFFDYDGDGDLDMYLLNHSTHTERGVSVRPQRSPRHPRAGDRLFRNEGRRFADVSEQAGIHGGVEGYGLGVVASDFNLDGCIDLFVANDFQENDFLYLNNCDGTFRESIGTATGHTSRFSMGVDAADIDNDLRPDLLVLDMLPQREDILKTSENAESFTVFNMKTRAGYHPQFARNTLQLNRGGGRFSEIGYLAGVSATDWSWSALFADFDNDGRQDLFVTNGIVRRPNDLDYINYVSNDAVQQSLAQGIGQRNMGLLQRMPSIPLANHAFRNNGNLTFSPVADQWGLAHPGFSNGAAYVDLDGDGALDLVVNNINAPADIYRNRARERTGHHSLTVALRGAGGNTGGIGAKVIIRHGATRQMREQVPTRGFQSSVDPRLHFGLGAVTRVDSLTVTWADGRQQTLTGVAVDTVITLSQADARPAPAAVARAMAPIFSDVTATAGIAFRHRENDFEDYNRDLLVPHKLSTEGPALAVGDVNGDGQDDVYIGGGKWQPGAMLLQTTGGRFRENAVAAFAADSLAEDVDAAFFDADGDRDLDLYVVSAGNEFAGRDDALRDRLYLNDGRGRFTRARDALPDLFDNGSCVAAGDFDGDGDVDLFVGTRVIARQYGRPAASRLLENDGRGKFRDVTAQKAPVLLQAGMVTDCAWMDREGQGRPDLVIVGEWMPVRIFREVSGRFEERASTGLESAHGWWNSVTVADLNGDGRHDLVLGNLGLNSYIRASAREPARMYVHDFGQTGTLKQILTFYKEGVSYPMVGRDAIVRQIPALRARYPSYASFGKSRVEEILSADELKAALVLEARTFETAVALANADGTFRLVPLPTEAQFAPVLASIAEDFDGDGRVDILLAGNFWGVTPLRGRYDASHGLLLRGDGGGAFTPVDMAESGVDIIGQVRDLQLVRTPRGRAVIAARNDDIPAVLRSRFPPSDGGTSR